MSLFSKPLAGPGYIVLNILRFMNIIALAMVVLASWVMLVKTFVVSKFFFFDAVSHLVTSFVGLFLIVSEIQLFKSYFSRNWPLLSQSSGLVTLGAIMVVLGVSVLGNLNKQATSQESLGTPFWRIVIGGGILVAILGLLNIIASYIFRDPTLDITARQVRSKGAVAAHQKPGLASRSASYRSHHSDFAGERNASVRSNLSRSDSRRPLNPRMPLNISRPINFNEQFREYVQPAPLQRPDDAHHPVYCEKV